MKKHLIALAVASAIAVPAMAQNVSISGRIDTAVSSTKNTSGQTATRMSATGLLTTPQIVIAGSEDLGGGLKANFNVTSGYTTDANNDLSFGSRGLTVGLSGAFGSIDLGKTQGTTLNSIQAGSVNGDLGNLGTLLARPNNSISYVSPNLSGLTVRALHSTGDTEGTNARGNKSTEVSATYANGPISVRAARMEINNGGAAITTADGTTNIFGSALAGAVTVSTATETGADVNYNAGFARFNVRYTSIDRPGDNDDRDSLGFGVAVPMGNGITIAADYYERDNKGTATNDHELFSVTLVKDLSKRTNVYAAYASKDNQTLLDERLFGVGIRHAF